MKTIEFHYSKSGQYRIWLNLYSWLNCQRWNRQIDSYRNVVCDSLGEIDTLGSHGDYTRFTHSHSCEGFFMWGFTLPFITINFYNE